MLCLGEYMPTRRYPHHHYEINGLLLQLDYGISRPDVALQSPARHLLVLTHQVTSGGAAAGKAFRSLFEASYREP